MKEFSFHSPRSLAEALDVLQEMGHEAKLLAGGTDLLLHMRAGMISPKAVISLKRISALQGIMYSAEEGLRLGASITMHQIARSVEILDHYPVLATTASMMASEQIRTLATVGGNLCNGSPSADLAPPLIAMDAEACIVGPRGTRQEALNEFFTGPGETVLEPDEILTELIVPPPEGETLYIKHAPRAYMDIAIVGVAAGLAWKNGVIQKARLVLGAVAPVPLRVTAAEDALLGTELQDQHVEHAADLAEAACSPISDTRGSASYRRRMVSVLVRRALQTLREGEPLQATA